VGVGKGRRPVLLTKPIDRDEANETSNKLKVAIVAPSLRFVGGQAVQAELLFRLWQGDPDVDAIFIAVDPPLHRWTAWAQQIRGLRTILRQPLYILDLWRGLANVDVAHIFASSYWSFLIAAAPAWLLGKCRGNKTLLNYHNGDARDHLWRFRSAVFVLSEADEIVVPSGYLVDVLGEFGLRAIVVPNLVDLSQFRYRPRPQLRPHLICTRGFSTYYKVDVVVRAFAEVKRVYSDARLDLIGEGPLEGDIRSLVASMKLTEIRFTGVASRHEIGNYYDQADIFINGSCVDAMPVSVIEAFRSGTPVVTTSPEAMPYLVEHERTGLLSAVDDEKGLAGNVIRLLRDNELAANLAENAYRESRKYEWGVVRDQWLNLYRGMLGSFVVGVASENRVSGGLP
jgi:glycosyltransferase involved in cell wall biosynthesis